MSLIPKYHLVSWNSTQGFIKSCADKILQCFIKYQYTRILNSKGIKFLGKSWNQNFLGTTEYYYLLSTNHLDGLASVGGSDFCILINTLIGCISWLGGSIWANSIKVIPGNKNNIHVPVLHKVKYMIWFYMNMYFYISLLS